MKLEKKFSIAHFDRWPEQTLYYEAIKNSSQQFKNEIYDIYFGSKFKYQYSEQELYDDCSKLHQVVYGNVMGVEASEVQIDNLFKIQKEFGIEISLTINQLNIPVEIFYSKNDRVIGAFLDWMQGFYDRGLRSCTLANNHIMRTGFLPERFPEMKWKNTVNQQVATAQQVLDYLSLGYNIIQLDRSLNRNMDELKRVKEVIENYRNNHPEQYVKTCMLVWEDCMPACPFKREHDDLQIYHERVVYWDTPLARLTCKRWRNKYGRSILPRCGTDCFWSGVNTFNEYAELVDIFKFSGRLNLIPPKDQGPIQFAWLFLQNAAQSFSEIIENRLDPIHPWLICACNLERQNTDINAIKDSIKDNFWISDKGKKLENRLKNCKNQCYRCHLCERSFGLPDMDSMIQ
jgi:hypothetical protein